MLLVKFHGMELLFPGESLVEGGFLADREAYVAGTASYAHLGKDGKVRRYHEVVGSTDDVEVLGPVSDPMDDPGADVAGSLRTIMTHPSWEGRPGGE
jgi:hypothetical protein